MEELYNGGTEDTEREIWLVHDSFWQALGDRDVEKRFQFCADTVTFIGSGLNEKAACKDEYIAINRKGIEQFPGKFTINILWRRLSLYDSLALVETEVEWTMIIDGRPEKEMLRNTVVLKRIDGKWLILHVHGSMPDYRLAGQNYITNADTSSILMELEKQVFQRTRDLNQAMETLRSTQSQLIQSEKMASLGELTAGIAHEIQNPLNFVNNFSQVSKELIEEVKSERAKAKGERDEQLEEELLNDITLNLDKIHHHGKRADAIVKGMLQHSRTSTGQKEPTDINALCDEYLRLAYHGLKARDKSIEASIRFEPDNTLPKINMVPQDIGRVLLNLINNAFQAVAEKQKSLGPGYVPEVILSTKLVSPKTGLPDGAAGGLRGAEIWVKDNGPGIPDTIKEKIFQPFFTTKPTGQGTGLGLSLSYDIVKAHGGELKAETLPAGDGGEAGEGSTFIIYLPVQENRV